MELRSTENQVQEMLVEYRRLCRETKKWHLPEIASSNKEEQEDSTPSQQPRAEIDILSTLESLHQCLNDMKPKMDRFRKRLDEKDPITDTPRYGEKTASRVNALLITYHALKEAIGLAFGESGVKGQRAVVPDLRLVVAQQEEAARQTALEQEEQRKKQEEEQRVEGERQEQERQRRQEESRLAQEREEAELARRAREARAARQELERRAQEEAARVRDEAERFDREWMDSITKGPDGVREQLNKLRASTTAASSGDDAYQTALTALHTLFSQIVSHPEEVKFRRVRRDHPRFWNEIGQHAGGKELLIAAGFRLGTIDDVPCFISTEPDIEKEMDAWSEWFGLLKATLELLDKEILK